MGRAKSASKLLSVLTVELKNFAPESAPVTGPNAAAFVLTGLNFFRATGVVKELRTSLF